MPTKVTRLSNPPIQEALIDFKFSIEADNDLAKLQEFTDRMARLYPKKQEKVSFGVHLKNESDSPSFEPKEKQVIGFMQTSQDGQKIVQSGLDNFTFNYLAPYKDWEELKKETLDAWKIFNSIFHDVSLKRVAIRYINNLNIEIAENDSLTDYILMVPLIPDSLPTSLENIFMQVTIPGDDSIKANITEGTKSIKGAKVNFIFDIDVYKLVDYSGQDSRIVTDLEAMREFKNDIFFGTITEKTLKNYQ